MNNVVTHELPSLQQEIDRKALEAFSYVLRKYEQGEWSSAEARAAMDALFIALCGVTDDSFGDIFREIDKALPVKPFVIKRIFIDSIAGAITILIRQAGEAMYHRYDLRDGVWRVDIRLFEHEHLPEITCHQRFQEEANHLIAAGFKEI